LTTTKVVKHHINIITLTDCLLLVGKFLPSVDKNLLSTHPNNNINILFLFFITVICKVGKYVHRNVAQACQNTKIFIDINILKVFPIEKVEQPYKTDAGHSRK